MWPSLTIYMPQILRDHAFDGYLFAAVHKQLRIPAQPASCSEKTEGVLNRSGYVQKCAMTGKLRRYNLLISNFICLN